MLGNLKELSLDRNQLSGAIPPELGNLSLLERLDLFSNQLEGSIPAQPGDLSNLVFLHLSGNRLTGEIPAELGKLANLERLVLFNNRLTGIIPGELGNLTSLKGLQLYGNQLSGAIPSVLGQLIALEHLKLDMNRLSGVIPWELGSLTNLKMLGLGRNQLQGAIPASLSNLVNLTDGWGLALDNNAFYTGDPLLDAFLDAKSWSGDWSSTQTVPPTGVTAANRTASSIDLQWDLIEYTGDDGGYHVFYGNQPGGPYRNAGGATTDKLTGSLSVFGLAPPPQHYFFVVRTRTDAHGLQRNTVWSGHSKQVCVPAGAPDDADCDDLPDS